MTSFHEARPFERTSGQGAIVVYLDGRHASWDLETLTNNVDIAYAEAVIADVAKADAIDREHALVQPWGTPRTHRVVVGGVEVGTPR